MFFLDSSERRFFARSVSSESPSADSTLVCACGAASAGLQQLGRCGEGRGQIEGD